MSNLQLICAGFSEMFQVPIATRAELEAKGLLKTAVSPSDPKPKKITVNQLFQLTYRVTMSAAESDVILPREEDTIGFVVIRFLTGNTISVPIVPESTVCDVQRAVAAHEKVPRQAIRLIYGGVPITQQVDIQLREKAIGPDDVLNAVIVLNEAPQGLASLVTDEAPFYIDDDLLDPSYDYDFTNIDDGTTRHMRGGYQYKRPCGWKRFALRVLGVYGDDKWLNSAIGGDWPVSYHGIQLSDETNENSPDQMNRDRFGKGHYSSPNVLVAEKYGTKFTFGGVRYVMVLQNRMNPNTMTKIPQSKTGDLDEYWITTNAEDIRAYSICVKKI